MELNTKTCLIEIFLVYLQSKFKNKIKIMRKLQLIMMGLFTLVTMFSFGQDTLTYEDVSSSKQRHKGKFDTYIAKDGSIYTVGDTINVGIPSGINGRFVHLCKVDIIGTIYQVGREAVNTHIILKNIRVGGTKRSGWKVSFQTKGMTFIDNYFLFIEDAIVSGEINSSVITSDEALNKLKKEKDKLDLGLITQEEFDKIKEELSKYIK